MKAIKTVALLAVLFVVIIFVGAHSLANHIDTDAETRQRTIDRWATSAAPREQKAARLCKDNLSWMTSECDAVAGNEVQIGMTKFQVLLSWGKPKAVNATITASLHREQWVYSGSQYLYFNGDKLTSMQSPSRPGNVK